MKKKLSLIGILIAISGCANETLLELEGGLYMKKGISRTGYLAIEDQKTHRQYRIKNPDSYNLIQRQRQNIKLKAKLIQKAKGPVPAIIEVLSIEK